MIAPVQNVAVYSSQFGGELIISWELPDILPEKYKIFVFKRSNIDVQDSEIQSYFASIDDLSNFPYNGLFVFDRYDFPYPAFSDIRVENDKEYYYKVAIRDQESGEVSVAVGDHAKPFPVIRTNVKDGKDIVVKSIGKLFDNIMDSSGRKVLLGKDVLIIKNFAFEPPTNNFVMVERVNGSTQYKFWGNQYQNTPLKDLQGDIDIDTIRATFVTTDSPDRRDLVCNIFRANKQVLIKFAKAFGAVNCEVNIEGDYYNPDMHGLNATGFTVIFSLTLTNLTMIPTEKLTAIIEEIKVENPKEIQ